MKRIGITTIFTDNNNYGGVLQAYALQRSIKETVGNEDVVEHVNFEYGANPIYPTLLSRCKQYSLKQVLKKFLERRIENKTYLIAEQLKKRLSLFESFRSQLISQSRLYRVDEHSEIGKDYDFLITGSDQVWNPNVVRDVFMFDFPTKAQKIAYAASISRNKLSKSESDYMIPRIKKFDHIGVREKTAKAILDTFGVQSHIVIDPTMLLSKEKWNEVSSPRIIPGQYVLVYSFSDCKLKTQIADYYKPKGIKVVYIPYAKMVYNKFDGDSPFEKLWDVGPSEFLSLINYADHVYTDSFHGTVFSIIFNTPFTVFERDSKAGKVNMNSRLSDLLETFGLKSRLSNDELNMENIDFDRVNQRLQEERNKSLRWLSNSLAG